MKNTTTPAYQIPAVTLHAALSAIDPAAVPVMSRNPRIPRKRRAALGRKLFTTLGLWPVSVTTPRRTTTSAVEISLPIRAVGASLYLCSTPSGRPATSRNRADYIDPAISSNFQAHAAVLQILRRAFPKCDNRDANHGQGFSWRHLQQRASEEGSWAIFHLPHPAPLANAGGADSKL